MASTQIRTLAARLKKAAAGQKQRMCQLAMEQAKQAVLAAQQLCDTENLVDTGRYRGSFGARPGAATGTTCSAEFYNHAPYALFLEYGHRSEKTSQNSASGGFVPGRYVHKRALEQTRAARNKRMENAIEPWLENIVHKGGGR